MKNFLFLASLAILFGSCDVKEHFDKQLKTPAISYTPSYQMVKFKEFDINPPEGSPIKYRFVELLNDSLLFCKEHDNEIDVYDIVNKKFLKRIPLDIYNVKPKSFSLSKNQEILVNDGSRYYKANEFGKLIGNYNLGDVKLTDSLKNNNMSIASAPVADYTFSEPIFLDTNRIVVSFPAIEPFLISGDDLYRVGILDLKKGKCVKYLAKPENVYSLMEKTAYPVDLSVAYRLVKGDTLFVSYPMDHYVYGYNINSGKLLFKKAAVSKNVSMFPDPLTKGEYSDRKVRWEFRVSTPFYEKLNYHSGIGMYTRIIHYPQPVKDASGKLNNGYGRKSAVIIMDKDLNIVGETVFSDAFFGVYKSVATSDGLIFGSQENNWTSKTKLIYRNYYKISKI